MVPAPLKTSAHALMLAERLVAALAETAQVPFIYKSSCDKAVRSALTSYRGRDYRKACVSSRRSNKK